MILAREPSSSSVTSAEVPVEIGQILAGKYEVMEVIGIGGMGVVVAARHVQLEQKVALKFLRPEAMQSEEAVQRFLREAKAAVRLRSEHVAKVVDVGTLDTGAPYMVMEFLDGADLSQVVAATGSITIEEAVHFVLQASEAIAEAHSLGIIHRDLKPQNLFVTRRVDGRPLIKVLDFGISKSIDPSGLSLTRTSSIMGSPLYMSPEQMRSSKNVDQRSDVWALGVILYELLTGRVPFEAEAVPELCLKVVQDSPEPPKSLRPEIPEGLNAVVLKCLEKEPRMRFANVAELAEALEPYSEASRGASERIASTLNVPSRSPMVSIPAPVGSASNPKIGTGGTAWGKTQEISTGRKRIPLIAGGAALLLVSIVGIVIAVKSSGASPKAEPPTENAAQTPSAAAPAQTAPVAAQPTEKPTAETPPAPTAPPAASASAAAEPTAAHAHRAHAETVRHAHGSKPAATATTKAPPPAVTAPPKTFE